MSPTEASNGTAHHRFPRVSGDEPGYITGALGVISFSPRERG